MTPFITVSGKMSTDKSSKGKRAGPEPNRVGRARTVATQPVEDAVDRTRLLSDRLCFPNDYRIIEDHEVGVETFTLPLEAARLKVRDIIEDISPRGYLGIIERWRQLPDGKIEFTMRRVPAAAD